MFLFLLDFDVDDGGSQACVSPRVHKRHDFVSVVSAALSDRLQQVPGLTVEDWS
jgi:hypothetical protein